MPIQKQVLWDRQWKVPSQSSAVPLAHRAAAVSASSVTPTWILGTFSRSLKQLLASAHFTSPPVEPSRGCGGMQDMHRPARAPLLSLAPRNTLFQPFAPSQSPVPLLSSRAVCRTSCFCEGIISQTKALDVIPVCKLPWELGNELKL